MIISLSPTSVEMSIADLATLKTQWEEVEEYRRNKKGKFKH